MHINTKIFIHDCYPMVVTHICYYYHHFNLIDRFLCNSIAFLVQWQLYTYSASFK